MSPPEAAQAARPSDWAGLSGSGRLERVDAARGVALLAMALYHLLWDLEALGLASWDVALGPFGRLAARAIAGSFLFLVGVGLVLGHGDGIRWKRFARRLAMVAGAAGTITAATMLATPDSYIFFGILHCIALASLLALPFLRAPIWVVLATGVLVLAVPAFVGGGVFDAPALAWLGLRSEVPETSDYVPIVPWLSPVLLGIAAARLGRPWLEAERGRGWQARGWIGPALVFAGRHSLAFYLLHQPVMLAILYPLALALA